MNKVHIIIESCLNGIILGNTCKEKCYSTIPGFKLFASLSSAEVGLVVLRSGISISSEEISCGNICSYQHTYYLRKNSKNSKKNSCDIFEIHSDRKPKVTHTITSNLVKKTLTQFHRIFQAKSCVLPAEINSD